MTSPAHQISNEAQQFNWLLTRFATETAGVSAAIAVSADGLLMAMSAALSRSDADRLAAIVSAVNSLAGGASRLYDLGASRKVIIDLERGYLLVSSISGSSTLGVLARSEANLGDLAYEMAVFANRTSGVLTPGLINELKSVVGE
ncbi:roadblock/LC7 domain-containing protein [Catellatospora citrea]|uniref:Dynein regulation protein LC7 n=1 Tax=Catellatospora citrea TaxID=53366 RepID=A0A8J3KDC1_9ACTN|nr:roadblock/LC7 domain-containing protein [Catellatospora citrea]RKE10745.1 hypothetical protein C8E86_5662 [Catellatospora citrea]GIG01122.1 dynein regulation protein LC7 [Catellatospora citrea]